ncbi:MAG: type II toxin-antitoxin system mRNA interferase toxin, RelE/StbE family [Sulfurovum sp.]|nr:MAG: type II toxin-antitoxin system mRNA interferase toxin, RelE/StbE family [Sulfurovum sp.]
MVSYSIEIKKSASKEIEKLPKLVLKRILSKIQSLSAEPRPHGCKKLTADEKYRVRVGGYRILYRIEDDKLIVYIVKVGHRKKIYD